MVLSIPAQPSLLSATEYAEKVQDSFLAAFLGLLLGYADSYDAATSAKLLQLTTDKPEYNSGETVTFEARNLGSETLVFPDSALAIEIKTLDTGTSCGIIAARS